MSDEQLAELKKLYPHYSDAELLAAKETIDRYLLLAWEIYEDLERESFDALSADS